MAEFSRSLDMAKRFRKVEIIENEEGRSLLKEDTKGGPARRDARVEPELLPGSMANNTCPWQISMAVNVML